MSRDKNKPDAKPGRIASFALFSSALAFASRSVQNTVLAYAMLAGALCLFAVCIVMIVKASRK